MAVHEICQNAELLGRMSADIDNLKEWQNRQNGSLKELADEIKNMKNWIMGLLGTALLNAILLIANLMFKMR